MPKPAKGNQPKPKKATQPSQGSSSVPMWLSYANAGGAGLSAAQANQSLGGNTQYQPVYGKTSQKKIRGAPIQEQNQTGSGTIYVESPFADKPGGQFNFETKKKMRGTPEKGVTVEATNHFQTPQFLADQESPSWLQSAWEAGNQPYHVAGGPGANSPALQAAQQTAQQTAEKPYRIQNPDGSWSYLQSDGTYLASWGSAGGVGDMPTMHNSYNWMPPMNVLPPPKQQQLTPYSSQYKGWGGGGGGGGGYTYPTQQQQQRTPAWYMNLRNWNFGE